MCGAGTQAVLARGPASGVTRALVQVLSPSESPLPHQTWSLSSPDGNPVLPALRLGDFGSGDLGELGSPPDKGKSGEGTHLRSARCFPWALPLMWVPSFLSLVAGTLAGVSLCTPGLRPSPQEGLGEAGYK